VLVGVRGELWRAGDVRPGRRRRRGSVPAGVAALELIGGAGEYECEEENPFPCSVWEEEGRSGVAT